MSRRWILAAFLFVACGSSSKPAQKPPQTPSAAPSTSVPMQGIDDDIPPPLDVDDDEH